MSKHITFIDQVGRNILGVKSDHQSSGKLTIDNPVMIVVQPVNGQLQIQLVPLFFAEFIKYTDSSKRKYTFEYAESTVAIGINFDIDEKIISQYDRIINGTFNAVVASQTTEEPKVIKLFND